MAELVCSSCGRKPGGCRCPVFPAHLSGPLCRCQRRLVSNVPGVAEVGDLCNRDVRCNLAKGHPGDCAPFTVEDKSTACPCGFGVVGSCPCEVSNG